VRRLNRYVEESAPWKLAKEPERAGELAVTLRSLAEGLRVVTVLLHAYLPQSTAKLLDALGAPATDLDGAVFGAVAGGAPVGELAPLFPRPE
jgi:methionyl-tRNA synthetase